MPSREKQFVRVSAFFLNFFRYLSRSVVSLRRSTFGKVHLFLLGRITWYSKWHRHPHHRKVHYSALALTCLLVGASIVTTLFPNPSGVEAAVATWDFTYDNTKYDYDTNKVSMAGGNASLTNPGSATGASTNINAASGTTTNTSASFASANKEYLTTPNNSSLQTGDIDFEIGGWVRLDGVGVAHYLLSKYGEYVIYVGSNNTVYYQSKNGASNQSVNASNFGALSVSTWYFLRAWRVKSDSSIHISVNNVENSATTSFVQAVDTSGLVFGARYYPNLENTFFNGRLDSWYFQKRISTTNEATALYNAGAGRNYNDLTSANGLDTFKTGLTSWWDFNEEGGIRYDSKGTNHLTSTADPIIAPPVYGSELAVNGGFETAGAGGADVFGTWVDEAGDGVLVDEATIFHSGSHAVKLMGGSTPATYPRVYQNFTVTPSASYYVSFWSRGDGNNSGRYRISNAGGPDIVDITSTNNPTTTYQLFVLQFTAPAGCVLARLFLDTPNVTGGIAYFDDVSVKQITTAAVNNGGFDLRPATGGEKYGLSTVSRSRTSNVATLVVTDHGLKNGDVISISGMTDATFNATGKVVTVLDANTITYASTGSEVASGGDTGGKITTDVFSSWNENVGSTSNISADSANAFSGTFAAKYVSAANDTYTTISNAHIVGKKYTATAYLKSASGTPTCYMGANTFNITTSYVLYTQNYTATGTGFQISPYQTPANTVYIDQVTLRSLGPTAEVGMAASNATDGNFGAGFNGNTQWLNVATNAGLVGADADFGIGIWVNLDKKQDGEIFAKYNPTGDKREYRLIYGTANDRFGFGVSSDGTSATYISVSADNLGAPVVGNWYFIRCWHNSTANTINIQVNNGTANSASTSVGVYGGNTDLLIGKGLANGIFAGRLDGAFKINRILTTDEATSLYNNGKGLKYAQLPDSIKNDVALKGYWNLDEKSGTRYDSTSNANNLTDNGTVTQVQGVNYYEGTVATIIDQSVSNNTFSQAALSKRPTWNQSGINNKASMAFDGVDDGLVATGDKIGTGDVTVTSVINTRGWGGNTTGRIIDNGLLIYFVTSTGVVSISSIGGASAVSSAVSSIALNTSYVVTVTRTSVGVVNFYINGALSGTANQSSGTPVLGGDTYMGNNATGARAFDGNIGLVQIYNSILDPLPRNNIEKTLGAKYGITVATDAAALSSSITSSLYPTLSLNDPLRFSSLSSITPSLASSSTGTLRYQLTNNSTTGAGTGNSSSYYYHNGTNWVSANKYNAYQSNTAAEISSNLASFTNTILPTHNLKWRAFFITDGVDSPALSSINANFISDTEAPPLATLDTAKDSASTNIPLTTGSWYNYPSPSFTWLEPVDASTLEYEQPSGISGYLTYFGTDNTVNIGLTNGLVQTGINNAAFTWQAGRTYTVNQTLETGLTYYLKVIPVDNAGNAAHSADSASYNIFTYKYDSTLPTPIEYVQVAQVGCSTSPTFDLTWPASTDSLSGLKYYQYKVGVNGTVNTTTNTTVTVAPERENENVFYVRPVDNANNSNPTLANTIWQSTVFCSTQSVTLTSGPTYTKTLSTLTVDFETSRPTTSKVEVYKTNQDNTLEKVSTGEDTTLSLTHSVQVPNLTPDTNYKYKLFYKDQNNNEGESNYYEASTDLISLSHTTTNNLEDSLSSLTIIFETTKPARARVEVYKDTNKQQEVSTQDYTLNHHLTINNLTSGTTYTYKIFYIDQENNNYESSTYTTTTTTVGIVDLPTITSGPNSVNIIWKTNLPTTGQVQIKEGDTYKEPQGHITFLTDHNVTIQGLKSEKPYKLRIIWTDQSNKTDQTGWFDVNTSTSPSVGNLKAEVISPTKALISWETNYLAQSKLQYGVGSTDAGILLENKGQNFSKTIDNLKAGATYLIRVIATSEESAEFSATLNFTLPPLPSITNFAFEPNFTGSNPAYKFTWLTNTETSTVVYYRVKGTGEYKPASNPDLLLEHLVLIKDFQDQAIYEVYAAGTDTYGNVAKSDLNTITTPNDSRPPKISNLSTSVKSSGFADNQKAQVIVTWDTDELSTSQVEYANGIEGSEYQNRTKEEGSLSTSHVVVILDLEPSKIYHLRAISKDQANNPAYSQDTTVITGKVQKSVLDIILASLQKSLGWITKLFK